MNPCSEDDGALREWSSLSNLIKLIPNKIRRGLLIQDIYFTCIDIASDFIAIGSNVGIVYWCNRNTNTVKQLKPERGDLAITCIKLVSSVDHMLAVGDKSGIVSIFRIPKDLPKDLPEEYLKRYDSKTEVYTVRGIHKTQITALEWSLNGEKLFSGDSEGVVGFTQMDYYMNMTKSCEILNEKYRIVQLSFNNHQLLLVSTIYRSVVVDKNDDWKVSQIGQKERKILFELGSVFNRKSTSANPPLIYASRTGQRIWIADISGVVQSTLLFKDLLSNTTIPRIKLLNNHEGVLNCSNFEFSVIQTLRENLLVSYSSNLVIVINPESSSLIGVYRSYDSIKYVAVCKDEIFIIEGTRNVRRFGFTPDQFSSFKPGKIFETELPLGDTMLDLASKIKDAATIIAPLLKDYAEASPVTQISSPEVDYDVGIAFDQEELERSNINDNSAISNSIDISIISESSEVGRKPSLGSSIHEEISSTSDQNQSISSNAKASSNQINEVTLSETGGNNTKTKTRQSILDDIGRKGFNELVFSSNRKVRHSNKQKKKLGSCQSSVNSLTINGVTSSYGEIDSDTASTMSEIDSISTMTVSQTSSNSDFEFSKIDINQSQNVSTNKDLEIQVAKMLSLEDVLLNPPQLKVAPNLPSESTNHNIISRIEQLNFLNYSLSDESSSSDINNDDTHSISTIKQNESPSIKIKQKINENVNEINKEDEEIEEIETQIVLNFENNHFGTTVDTSKQFNENNSNLNVEKINKSKLVSETNIEQIVDNSKDDIDASDISYEVIEPIKINKESAIENINNKISNNTNNIKINTNLEEYKNDSVKIERKMNENDSKEDDNKLNKENNIKTTNLYVEINSTDITEINTLDATKTTTTPQNEILNESKTDLKELLDEKCSPLPDLLTCVENNLVNINEDDNDCQCTKENCKDKGYLKTLEHGWQCCIAPHTCVWLAISCHKVYFGGPRLSIYEADIREDVLNWNLLPHKASFLAVSPCNRYIWKSNIGVVSTYVPKMNEEWKMCARDVDSLCLTESLAWYTCKGKVYTQILPYSEPNLIACSVHVVKVVSSHRKTWVLSDKGKVLSRLLIKEKPSEYNWSVVETPSHVHISDIVLNGSLCWLIDKHNNIYFTMKGDASKTSDWWQLLIHGNFVHETLNTQSAQKPCIASNKFSIWISHPLVNAVYVNKAEISGYQWSPMTFKHLKTNIKWKKISAEGLFEDDGYIWFLSQQGEIYNYSPYSDKILPVPSPFDEDATSETSVENEQVDVIVSLESSPNALWIVTEQNKVYIRCGISTLNPTGTKWKKLCLEQFSSNNVKVQDISCSSDVVWMCSKRGEMFMCVHRPHEERKQNPAWISADGNALPNCQFTKVFVGPDACIVWAIDNKNNVYVREGIFYDYQLGVDWLYVPGILASHLTISNSSVWALSWEKCVYKRIGVSQNNFIGDYWQQIPEKLSVLTTSLNDSLYGISSTTENLLRLSSIQVIINSVIKNKKDGKYAGEWEIL